MSLRKGNQTIVVNVTDVEKFIGEGWERGNIVCFKAEPTGGLGVGIADGDAVIE